MVRRSLRGTAIVSGNINDLLEIFKSPDAPTAIMFTGDDAALKFRRIAAGGKKRLRPLITGFDDIATEEEGLESLTTYHIECEKMGGINLAQGVCDTDVPPAVLKGVQQAFSKGINTGQSICGRP